MHDHGRLHVHHPPDPSLSVTGSRRAVALAVLCLCAVTAAVDMTITNVALPFIGRELDAGTNGLQWTVDAYNLVLAGFLVLGGALADRHGRRRVFLLSFAVFGLASLLAAFSPSVEALVASRALMGLGAAGITAPALAIIASMYAPEERASAIGAFVVFGAAGLVVGPIAGGLLLDHFWWGSVFLVNVPVVVLGVVAGRSTIPESRAPVPEGGRPPLDVVGALMSVVGLTALLFGVIEGPNRGWTSPAVVLGAAAGVVVLGLFVRRELRDRSPLFDVRVLRLPPVAAGTLTLFVAYVLFTSFLFLNPQYLQDVLDEPIVEVGLLFVPFAVVFGLASLQTQRVLRLLGPRATIPLGLLLGAGASLLFAAALGESVWATVLASVVLGLALSVLIAPPSTVVMNALPAEKAGDGSSLNFVSRFVGASVGVAIVGSVLASGYVASLEPSLASLSPDQAAQAEGSVQGALEVAAELPATSGAALAASARDAFDDGARVAYAVTAGMAVLAAGAAWVALGRVDEPVPDDGGG